MGATSIPRHVQLVAVAAFGFAVVLLGAAAWDGRQRGEVIVSSDPGLITIVVEVRGEVARPGVYTLNGDGRVGEAIELAGGFTADADVRPVNLARRLADEEILVVPRIGAATPLAEPPGAAGTLTPSTELVNLNGASVAELEALPGIGEVLAARIVAYREAHGPFGRVEDLLKVEGISEGDVEALRDLVTVGP